jgi:foldase protein PrsA
MLGRRILAPAAAFAVIAGLVACGGSKHDSVAVRVGDTTITGETVARWMAALAPGHFVPEPPHYSACIARQRESFLQSSVTTVENECRQQYRKLERQALRLLISSQWLIGEAKERGLKLSPVDATRQLVSGGATAGVSGADAELATTAQQAEAAIRRALAKDETKVTPAEVAAYYSRNIRDFERRERRYFDIFEQLPSEAVARKAMQDVARPRTRAKLAIHESLDRHDSAEVVPWKRAIEKAIFAAKPHVLVGPLRLKGLWCFFEVTRVRPRAVKPLASVRAQIARRLADERRRRALARLVAAWRRRWITRTNCSPGYVVEQCRQYRGPTPAEDPLAEFALQ